jgi:hypothetical protein
MTEPRQDVVVSTILWPVDRGWVYQVRTCARRYDDLREVLGSLDHDTRYCMSRFRGDRKRRADVVESHAVVLDLDHGNPETADDHTDLPPAVWRTIAAAIKAARLPSGIYYPTRRGVRVVSLLAEPIADVERFGTITRIWGERVLRALAAAGVPLYRDGRAGLGLDEGSTQPERAYAPPASGVPILLAGVDLVPIDLEEEEAEEYVEPPVDVLPVVIRDLVRETSTAMGCDPAMILLPALATLAGSVGNALAVEVKRGWVEPCVIWASPIGRSGQVKSPPHDLAVQPVRDWEWRKKKETEEARSEYAAELADWEDLPEEAQATKSKPKEPPAAPRVLVSDVTVERLAMMLGEHPRGLLLARDELSAWLQGMTRYTVASDVPQYLEMHRAGTVVVDRVTRPGSSVRRAAVSICGTIQPRVWAAAMTEEVRAAGLPARLLVAAPPPRRKTWTDATVSPHVTDAWHNLIRRALDLPYDQEADPTPIRLSPAALTAFISWFEEGADLAMEADDDTAAAYAKLEGGAARLALVFHVAESLVTDGAAITPEIPGPTMDGAITLARWFRGEAERLYADADADAEDKAVAALDEWGRRSIKSGRNVTLREVQRSLKKYRGTEGRAMAVRHLRSADWKPEKIDPAAVKGPGRPAGPAWWPKGERPKPIRPTFDTTESTTTTSTTTTPNGDSPPPGTPETAKPTNNAGFVKSRSRGIPASDLVQQANRALSGTHNHGSWPRAGGSCPACGHHECFNRHPQDPYRWMCHSANHDTSGVGKQTPTGAWSGDLLDLECHARGTTDRMALAREITGYTP